MADPTQIHQVAMNLITNAFHAIEEKNGIINVTLKEIELKNDEIPDNLLHAHQYIQLSVSDNGEGMTQSIQNKIFDPYFTTKEKDKGTGLGLAVVYGIIKEHKGNINVYSEEGKGSTFNVYLPLMNINSTPVLDNQSLNLPTGTERILLVDDDISVAKLEAQMLSRLGYQVVEQTISVDALNKFKKNPNFFDLVITDMTMPNMTGDKLAKEIFAIRSDLPVIICTGFSERINKEQAEVIGVSGFLMKPVVKSEMAQMVRKVLDEAIVYKGN
jgi:CheY-like chemotaxis protein